MDLAIAQINQPMKETLQILKRNKLSITESRRKILNLFMDADGALTHADIENNHQITFDRVTVYRTLQTFVENGIIHQIPTTDNTVLYALCKENCEAGHHHDEHIHFICLDCDKTVCLDEVSVPAVKLPRGFKSMHTALVIKGICDECKN